MIRVCPMRDRVCPHGIKCPYVDGYNCTDPELRFRGEIGGQRNADDMGMPSPIPPAPSDGE